MNILIIPSWFPSKNEPLNGSFFLEQAIALSKRNNNVYIFDTTYQTRKNIFRLSNFFPTKHKINNVIIFSFTCFPLFTFKRPTFFLRYYLKLSALFLLFWKKLKIDIVHAHSTLPAGYTLTKLKLKYNIPIIVTEHSTIIFDKDKFNSYYSFFKKTLTSAEYFITLNQSQFNIYYGIFRSNNLVIIPNIVNDYFFDKSSTSKMVGSKKFNFVSVGSLISRKNYLSTIKAFHSSFRNNFNVNLYIVGEGDQRDLLTKLIIDLELKERVFLLGKKQRIEIQKILSFSDVFVLYSKFETFGVVYIESLACGLPILGLKNGGAEYIIESDNGYLVIEDKVEDLADGFKFMYENQKTFNKERMIKNCYNKYSEDVVVTLLTELYNSIKSKKYEEYKR
jgi:glycosyltransferase involved in cell wall biosynthesis